MWSRVRSGATFPRDSAEHVTVLPLDPRSPAIRRLSLRAPGAGALLAAVLLAALAGCSSGPADRVAAPSPAPTTGGPLPPDGGATRLPTDPPTDLPTDVPSEPPTAPSPTVTGTPTGTPSATRVPTRPPTSSPPAQPVDPLSPGSPLETAPPVGRPTCAASALTVTDADSVYTAEAVQELFTVRTSGPDCQLPPGYPAVQVLDATGAAMGAVGRGGFGLPAPGATPITLSRTTSLSFFVATDRDGTCLPAATVTVVLPGTSSAVRAATRLQVCGGALGNGPVQRLGDDE